MGDTKWCKGYKINNSCTFVSSSSGALLLGKNRLIESSATHKLCSTYSFNTRKRTFGIDARNSWRYNYSKSGVPLLSSSSENSGGEDEVAQSKIKDTKAERVAKLKLEAERLELEASRAALDHERAKLAADKKKLELEALKLQKLRTELKMKKSEIQETVASDSINTSTRISDEPDSSTETELNPAENTEGAQQSPSKTLSSWLGISPEVKLDGLDSELAKSESVKEYVDTLLKMREKLRKQMNNQALNEMDSEVKTSLASGSMSGSDAALQELFAPDEREMIDESSLVSLLENVMLINPVFTTSDFEYTPNRLIFKGKMSPDVTPDRVLQVLESDLAVAKLDTKLRLFLLPDPSDLDGERQCVIVLSKNAQPASTPSDTFISISSAVLGTLTSIWFAHTLYTGPVADIDPYSLEFVTLSYPIWAGVLLPVIVSDCFSRLAATLKGLKLSIPTLLPSLQIGLFGRISNFEKCFPRNRSDQFDVVAAGHVSGLIVSLSMLTLGLIATNAQPDYVALPQLSSNLLSSSLLVKTLGNAVLSAGIPPSGPVALHPLAISGYASLVVSSLNMIPIGRLEGGLISQSIVGRDRTSFVSSLFSTIVGIGACFVGSDLIFFWAFLAILFRRSTDLPQRDEITEIGPARTIFGLVLFTLAALTLFPSLPSL
mmetsp:Transcript_6012/g.10684  ORF Transcript_6012/g.10684 Transcript_6012/m.10684 type:complete len:662 (-) Transcript_6012:268-2253(-)